MEIWNLLPPRGCGGAIILNSELSSADLVLYLLHPKLVDQFYSLFSSTLALLLHFCKWK